MYLLYSPVNVRFYCFQFLALLSKIAVNVHVQVVCGHAFHFSGTHLAGLLGHVISVYL